MADDIKVKYGSSGFETVKGQLSEMKAMGAGSGSWFTPIQSTLKEAESSVKSFTDRFKSEFDGVKSVVGDLVGGLVKVTTVIGSITALVAGTTTAAFTLWSTSVLKTTESFRMLETSMYGATKSWESVNKVSAFAKEYAAEYPAMYRDVMQAMQSFAYIPALKPVVQQGDVQNMKEMMTIVQGLMTMRPEQGVQGAIFALREALAGNWRSLQFRFDVPVASIAESAGMTMEQMKQSPDQAIKAMKAFIDSFVGAETMAMMAKNLSIQVGNLRDKYEMWIDKLGKTGIYDKVIDYLLKLNDAFDTFLKSDKLEGWTRAINEFLEKTVDRIASVFTEGVDWEGIADFSGLMNAFKKVAQNAGKVFGEVWDEIKGPLTEGLKVALSAAAEIAGPVIRDIFIPIGKTIGSSIIEGLTKFMEEHPILSAGILGYKGAEMGSRIGGKWGGIIGGVAGVVGGLTPWAYQGATGRNIWTGEAGAGSVEELLVSHKRELSEQDKILKEITDSMSVMDKDLTSLLDDIRGLGRGGALGAGTKTLAQREQEQEALEKMAGLREQTAWGYFQQWSRMGGMLAQAPETAPKTAWQKYVAGEIDWAGMQRQEKVEAFQKEQMTKLEEMVRTERGQELPSYGLMGRAYGEMFNIAYKTGDLGKAQDFMNQSLEALRTEMQRQTEQQMKEYGELAAINKNTAETVQVIKEVMGTDKGSRTTYKPAAGEEWTQDELMYHVREALRRS